MKFVPGIRSRLFLSILLLNIANSALGQAIDESRIENEIAKVYEVYTTEFINGNASEIAASIYAAPAHLITPEGGVVLNTEQDVEAMFRSTIDDLKAQEYARSEFTQINICVLNESSALLSSTYTRYKNDGSILMDGAATYTFSKLPDGWRIIATIIHEPEKLLEC